MRIERRTWRGSIRPKSLSRSGLSKSRICSRRLRRGAMRLSPQPNSRFDSDNGRRRIEALYGVKELAAFGDFSRGEIAALGALLDYVELTQKSDLKHFARPQKSGIGANCRRSIPPRGAIWN